MYKKLQFLALFLSVTASAEQFISLNLCSDRLLIELVDPHQIAAMSSYSKNPLMMLDKINTNKPTLEPQLTELLPYLDKTILINEAFYPQLVENLKKLNAKIVSLNDTPQTPEELFALIMQLGQLTEHTEKANALVATLRAQKIPEKQPLAETLILSETGVVETHLPQYRTLLDLLGLQPLKTPLSEQNFSLEKILLSQPNVLISLTDKQAYSDQAQLLSHPVLQHFAQNRPLATIPMKYTYCFDHGIWQGATMLYNQLK